MDCVIEYGPGTGVVTQEVARRIKGKTRFFAIEREPEFAEITRRRCPDIEVIEGCVTNVQEYCRERGIEKVDAILSGLPWASFPVSLTEEILDATFEVLPVGGKFATFAYWQGLLLPGAGASAASSRNISPRWSGRARRGGTCRRPSSTAAYAEGAWQRSTKARVGPVAADQRRPRTG